MKFAIKFAASVLPVLLILSTSVEDVKSQSTAECFPMEVTLVVPTSATAEDFGALKTFLRGVLTQVGSIGGQDATLQLAVVKYRGTAQREFGLGDHTTPEANLQAIDNMAAVTSAGNNVASALAATNSVYQATGVRTSLPYVAVIFFDGRSDDQSTTYEQARILNDFGIAVIPVGIGPGVDSTELSTVATQPSYVLTVSGYTQLDTISSSFLSTLCSLRTKLCPKQADIALVLDQSTSIVARVGEYQNWYSMLDFIGNITAAFRVSPDLTQFGVVKFSDNATVSFPLNQYSTNDELLNSIKQLEIEGGETNIAAALRIARTQLLFNSPGSRFGVKKILFLITDGAANRETQSTFTEANQTKDAGVEIFCIGITNDIDEQQLQQIASIPVDDHFFYATDFSTVNSILEKLYATTCAQPQYSSTVRTTVRPVPTSPATTEAAAPETTVAAVETTAAPAPETTAAAATSPPPQTTSTTRTTTPSTSRPSTTLRNVGECSQVDVVFVIDTSGSLDPSQFPAIKQFIVDVASTFPIEDGTVQVGLVTFSTTQNLVVPLNGQKTFDGLKTAILAASYSGQSSNKADAFTFLRTNVFTSANGARQNVPPLAVLITNSRSPNQVAALREADLLRRAGITILTIALGTWLDINEIYAIGSFPKEVFNFQTAMSNLSNMHTAVNNLICSKSAPCDSNPCQNGGVCSALFGYYQCKCATGYGGQNCDKECQGSGDVVFAIDSSGSIGPENWRLNIDFITKVVGNMDLDSGLVDGSNTGMRCAFIVYSDSAVVKFQLNSYTSKNNLLQGLQTLYMAGTTNTANAIRLAIDECFTPANGDRPTVPNYLVVVTDGKSNNTELTVSEAQRARTKGISILAIGVADYNYEELRGIASAPDSSNVITAANYSSLSDELADKINSLLCSSEDYCASNPCQNGADCKKEMGGYTCGPCPTSFTGAQCERACSGYLDLILMLDVSGSINYDRFPMIKEFLIDIVRSFDVHADRTRIGAIYFADQAGTAFTLGEYSTRQDVIQSIRDIPFAGGRTDIAEGLRYLRTQFSTANGGRSDAPRIVVIITDAMVNENMGDTIPEGILVKNDNIEVVMVLVGQDNYVDMGYAEALVSGAVATNVIHVSSYSALPTVTGRIINSTCDDVDECSSSPCQNGGTCVNRYQRYACICPLARTGFNCDRNCNKRLDLVFILDFSGSVIDIRSLVSLIREIIYGLDVANDQVHVGIVTYATDVTNHFYLNTYAGNLDHLINAISFYQNGGTTNTQAALRHVLQNQLTAVNGDRAGIPNVVIWVSDGYSNEPEGSSPSANAGSELKQAGATVYTVGVGESPNVVELEAVASEPASMHNFLLRSTNSTDVRDVAQQIIESLCSA